MSAAPAVSATANMTVNPDACGPVSVRKREETGSPFRKVGTVHHQYHYQYTKHNHNKHVT